MAKKSATQTVKDKYPDAEHISMGIPGLTVHSIYINNKWEPDNIIGQSTVSKKEAWITAMHNINKKGGTGN